MKCTIKIRWDRMLQKDREGLLNFLRSEDFKETPLWLRWMSEINPEERVFAAPKDTGRFSEREYRIFLALFRVLAEFFPSLEAKIHGHVDSGIRKFDLGGYYDLTIKNGEVDESFTGIP